MKSYQRRLSLSRICSDGMVSAPAIGVALAFVIGFRECNAADSTSTSNAAGTQRRVFRHPGVLNTREELDFIKKQIQAGAQPWKRGFDQMKSSHYAALSYKPHPIEVVGCGPYSRPDIGCGAE